MTTEEKKKAEQSLKLYMILSMRFGDGSGQPDLQVQLAQKEIEALFSEPTPPETGREWEDKIDWKKQVEGSMSTVFINNRDTDVLKGSTQSLIDFLERKFHIIESSALSQGEKIGREKERERIKKLFDMWYGLEKIDKDTADDFRLAIDALKGEL